MILKFMWNCKYGTTKTILERNSKVDEYKTWFQDLIIKLQASVVLP
jgi:hypothetical protein